MAWPDDGASSLEANLSGDEGGNNGSLVGHGQHGPPDGALISVAEAAIHLIRANFGPGMLALPFAFANAGWSGGSLTMLLTICQGVYVVVAPV